jgi:hypothetical protein
VDQRIESFLADVLALAGEDPDAIREGVRVALADCEEVLRAQETNKRMKDKAAHACHALCRARVADATCGRRACGKRTRGRARLIDMNCRRPRHLQSRNRSTRWSGQIGGNATKLLHGVNARQCLVFPRPSADRRQLKYLRLISSVCKRGLKDELG